MAKFAFDVRKATATVTALAAMGAAPPAARADGEITIAAEDVRSLDGSLNNLRHPTWGMAGTPYLRLAPARYADGVGEMVAGPRPRYLSNRIFNDRSQNLFSENAVTQWGFAWGQFIDHTFGLRDQRPGERSPIPFSATDPLESFKSSYDSFPFERTPAAPGTGATTPREHINQVSSYIDASNVYGDSPERLEWLREGPVDGDLSNNGARLLLTPDGHLPRAEARGDAAKAPTMDLVGRLVGSPASARVAGDFRANENIALTSLHTLFAREHNRIVDGLPTSLSEEEKFQIARWVVGAEQQYITYEEFLPALGVGLSRYRGYDRGVDASLGNEFATVGFRAHSMIHGEFEPSAPLADYTPAELDALRAKGVTVEIEGDEVEFAVPLNVAFANPDLLEQIGMEAISFGLGGEREYNNDEQIDDQLRSVLFLVPGPGTDPAACLDGKTMPECFQGVVDLGALDVARGRDHGMPPYNDLRRAFGLEEKASFQAITGEPSELWPMDAEIDHDSPMMDSDILDHVELRDARGNLIAPGTDAAEGEAIVGVRRTPLAARLRAVYRGDVGKVDAFVGMLSEPHERGSELGELQRAIWRRQFEALRDGDRFFYEAGGPMSELAKKHGLDPRVRLSEVIVRNTELEPGDLQRNVFEERPE